MKSDLEQKAILDYLRDGELRYASEIAAHVGMDAQMCGTLLGLLSRRGDVIPNRGRRYRWIINTKKQQAPAR